MKSINDRPPMLSVDQVARYCGVSSKTVRRWLVAKTLPCHRLGRRVCISQDDLDQYLWKHRR
jgi:excisionase family DNA binding protein